MMSDTWGPLIPIAAGHAEIARTSHANHPVRSSQLLPDLLRPTAVAAPEVAAQE